MGFAERLLADAMGFGAAGPWGGFATHIAANRLPITATKSLIGKTASKISNTISKVRVPNIAGPMAADIAGASIPKVKNPYSD